MHSLRVILAISIWHSKVLIKEGTHWLVGNENNIMLWSDPWVHDVVVHTPLPSCNLFQTLYNCKLASSIMDNNKKQYMGL